MRYVLYDKATGEIVHSHEFYRIGEAEPQEVSEDDLRYVLSRFPTADGLDVTRTEQPSISSRLAEMTVDLKTGDLIVKQLAPDPLSQKLEVLRHHNGTGEE